MKFEIETKEFALPKNISKHEKQLAEKFAELVTKNTSFIKAVYIDRTRKHQDSLPVTVLIDDLSHPVTKVEIDSYVKKVRNAVSKTSEKLHVETLKLSQYWELTKSKDPHFIQVLRDAVSAYDTGFILPMKALLAQGRLRPSKESSWIYYMRAKATLKNSRDHLKQAVLDLYWAVIDVGHAVLMKMGEVPPKPSHVAGLLEEKLVKTKRLEQKYPDILKKFYLLSRKILHKQITEVKGEEFDAYVKDATDFIKRMKPFLTP